MRVERETIVVKMMRSVVKLVVGDGLRVSVG